MSSPFHSSPGRSASALHQALRRGPLLAAVGLVLFGATASRAEPPGNEASNRAARPDAAELARRIDARLEAYWEANGLRPAPLADEPTYLRRVSLDLLGRIPSVAEARAYLDDPDPRKPIRLVESLVDTPAATRQTAMFWRRTWTPQTDGPGYSQLAEQFDLWLARQLQTRAGYDALVRSLLSAPARGSGVSQLDRPDLLAASFFDAVGESKPEMLAANTARAFLGLNLDCAQCHDHPFARWTQDQFWQTAAFFSRPVPASDTAPVRLEIAVPDTERKLAPKYLSSAAEVPLPEQLGPHTGRELLGRWVTSPDNPYFARNAVNRLWSRFCGAGLVEPLDDLSEDNASPHAALLQELTDAFVASGYDTTYLTRAILLSRPYRLASRPSDTAEAEEPQHFALGAVRGLTGEQLYDSLCVVAGVPTRLPEETSRQMQADRKLFIVRFHVDRPAQADRSILQALTLMNGQVTSEWTHAERSPTVAAALAPFLSEEESVEMLFLAAYSRPPLTDEMSPSIAHLRKAQGEAGRRQALADIFWALVNSAEFNTNH